MSSAAVHVGIAQTAESLYPGCPAAGWAPPVDRLEAPRRHDAEQFTGWSSSGPPAWIARTAMCVPMRPWHLERPFARLVVPCAEHVQVRVALAPPLTLSVAEHSRHITQSLRTCCAGGGFGAECPRCGRSSVSLQ